MIEAQQLEAALDAVGIELLTCGIVGDKVCFSSINRRNQRKSDQFFVI